MKNLKKLLSTVLTATMLLGAVTTGAFAEGGDADNKTAELPISKTLEVKGDKVPNVTFNFKVEPVTVTDGTTTDDKKINVYSGIALKEDSLSIEFGTEGDKVSDGKITKTINANFNGVTFDKPGIYRYKVSEVQLESAIAGMNYDTKVYIVDVFVGYGEDGTTLKVLNVYAYLAEHPEEKKDVVFNNNYDVASLTIEKKVTGNLGEKDRKFDFTLLINDNDLLPEGSEVKGSITRQQGKPESVTITVGKDYDFQLAHGEKLVVSDLPIGTTYTVTEAAVDGYDTSITGLDENGIGTIAKDTTDTEGNTVLVNNVLVTNTKDTTKTGISVDMAPYAIILLLAAAAGVLFFIKKRNSYEG